jgi:cytoskeletal protein CcmA (bactofilin family)
MSHLDLELVPEPPAPSPAVLTARHRRALVVGLGGGRDTDSPVANSSFAERRLRSSDTVATRFVDPLPSAALPPPAEPATHRPASAPGSGLRLDDALVVPAGALIRGYVRCRALLLVGDIVGNVHCTAGPVVIRSGASLKGRLVASGDVYVCGTVGDTGGGAVITTRGKLTLAPGARVDGDVRSGRLDVYDGATLLGAAKGCED